MARPPRTFKSVGLAKGFRSGLEDMVAAQLQSRGRDPRYETEKIEYVKPERVHKYTPDFPFGINDNGQKVYIESKGKFDVADRQKHLLIRDQHPDIEVRFLFSNSKTRISKGSPTRYRDWCDRHGFKYCDKTIPDEWFEEVKPL